MSRASQTLKRPRDIHTSGRPDNRPETALGLISPSLSPSQIPLRKTYFDSPKQPLSPAQPPTPSSPTVQRTSPPRLQAFSQEWTRIVPPSHPLHDIGRHILEDLVEVPRLEFPITLNCYAQPGVDLARHVQCDLDAIRDLHPSAVMVDARPQGSPSLTDGPSARAALAVCAPVAFDVQALGERGIRAAPDAQLGPHYFSFAVDRTLVAGSGTICGPYASRSRNATVLHAVLGQTVVLVFPITLDNYGRLPENKDARAMFQWAAAQPGATLRVLRPGDSMFVPPAHWRAFISLGFNGSSFTATILLYAKEVEPPERERSAKRVCV